MNHTWSRIHSFFLKRSQSFLILLSLALVIVIGYFDFLTGFEVAFSFLYLIPIIIATWYVSARFGFLITVISTLTWTLTNWAAGEVYSVEAIRYWNAFTRLAVFSVIILLLEEFKHAIIHERMLSQTDFLTGIANSREFYIQATAELERSGRSRQPITIAYIDLDGFKQVNDEFGHREGDQLLRTVAQNIQASLRKTDLFARLGGDEFVILFPNTNLDGAKCIMDRVYQTFRTQMEQLNIRVTLSAGVVSYISRPASVDEMLHKADSFMYTAKSAGKNRVFFMQGE